MNPKVKKSTMHSRLKYLLAVVNRYHDRSEMVDPAEVLPLLEKIDSMWQEQPWRYMTVEQAVQALLVPLASSAEGPSDKPMAHPLSMARNALHQLTAQAGYTPDNTEWQNRSKVLVRSMIEEEVKHLEDMPEAATRARLLRSAALVGLALLERQL